MANKISTGRIISGHAGQAPRKIRAGARKGSAFELFVPGDTATVSRAICIGAGDTLHISAWGMEDCIELQVYKVLLNDTIIPVGEACAPCQSGELLSPPPASIKHCKPLTECGDYVIMDDAYSDIKLVGPGCFQLRIVDGYPPSPELYVEASLDPRDRD